MAAHGILELHFGVKCLNYNFSKVSSHISFINEEQILQKLLQQLDLIQRNRPIISILQWI